MRSRFVLFAALALTSSWLAPSPASACGGFFCSQSTGGAPIDQAGEDIAYVVESDGSITMVVRIVYSGASTSFAWLLPVPVAPTAIEIGPDLLFTTLAPATAPTFSLSTSTEGTCRQPACDYPSYGGGFGIGCSSSRATAASDASVTVFDASARDAGGVHVVEMSTVGAYETVVLSGGTAMEVATWLHDNHYDLPPEAEPLIADYVAAHQLFVALRLRSGATNDAIQPIMLHLATDHPCLPIRLTSIATVPGLPIRAYILGDAPYVPSNYSVLSPPNDIGLYLGTNTWPVSYAAAVRAAGGHAWVRDFAGTPPSITLDLPALGDLTSAPPASFFTQVISLRGYPRAAVLSIAPTYLDPPAAIDLVTYVDGCSGGAGCPGTALRWDPSGLAAALEAQVRAPRQRLATSYATRRVLTRLYTALDAADMTIDPEFRAEPAIGLVSNAHTATLVTECGTDRYLEGAAQRMDFADGTSVRVRPANTSLDDDAVCRMRGATAHHPSGCAAEIGAEHAPLPLIVLGVVALALVGRRVRRH